LERYEYQVVKTPSKSVKYKGLDREADAFAQTLMDGMNTLARDGWQFVRTEVMVEQRRSWLGVRTRRSHDYMVYRRALRSNGMSLAEPVSPQRVRNIPTPNLEMLRDRISSVMSERSPVVALAKSGG